MKCFNMYFDWFCVCFKNALITSLKLDNGFLKYIYISFVIIGLNEQNSLNYNMKPR